MDITDNLDDIIVKMGQIGFEQEHIRVILDKDNIEYYTKLVQTFNLPSNETGRVCEITVPQDYRYLSIKGINPMESRSSAYPITLRCADTNDTEIAETTNAQIQTLDLDTGQCNNVYTVYHELSPTSNRATTELKVDSEKFRIDDGIMLESGQILRFNVITPNIDIDSNNVEITMTIDLWH